jgi:arylsulfatase A-like enzyme
LICQVDLLASLATLVGQKLEPGQGPDSQDLLTTLLGRTRHGRDHLVEHAQGLALRQGTWKLIPGSTGAPVAWQTRNETGNHPDTQLFDLSRDPGETLNLAAENPKKVEELTALLERVRQGNPAR